MPQLGEQKRGREIGKTPNHLFIWSACKKCKQERWVDQQQIQDKRYLGWCRKCGNYRNGMVQGRKNKKRGRKKTSTGYIEILLKPNDPFRSMALRSGYVKEHRYIIAQHMGRCLYPGEVVHHKDGNKTNNDLSNLEIVNKYNHKIGFADAYQKGYKDGYFAAEKGRKCEY